LGVELGFHLTQCCPGRGLVRIGILIHPAVWPQQTWAKMGGAVPPFGGSLSNTKSPGPRSTSMPSFILIHSTVWPQYTNVTERQDRQRSDSIGRTVFTARRNARIASVRLSVRLSHAGIMSKRLHVRSTVQFALSIAKCV